MTPKELIELLHNFAINYDVSSRESRKKCIDDCISALSKIESKEKIITFDKSALKFICETLNVFYDENITGFTKYGVIRIESKESEYRRALEEIANSEPESCFVGGEIDQCDKFRDIAKNALGEGDNEKSNCGDNL